MAPFCPPVGYIGWAERRRFWFSLVGRPVSALSLSYNLRPFSQSARLIDRASTCLTFFGIRRYWRNE